MMKSLIFRKRKISHLFSLKLLSITIAILALFGTIHISINLNSIENNLSPKLGGTEDLIFSEISEINDDSLGSSQGNGDGKADIGETIEMQIYLENTGTTDLSNINVVLTSSDPYVEIITSSQTFPLIDANDVGTSESYFVFTINTTCPENHIITFNLNIGGISFDLRTYDKGNIQYKTYQITSESDGSKVADDDGIADPGEIISVSVDLLNNGNATLFDLSGTIKSVESDPYLTFLDNTSDVGDINAGSDENFDFSLQISGACPDKRKLNFSILLFDSFNSPWNVEFDIVVNGTANLKILDIYVYDDETNTWGKTITPNGYYGYYIKLSIKNNGDAPLNIDWMTIDSEDSHVEWDNSYESRNQSYYYYSSLKIGEIANFTESYDWDFELKGNPPQNYEIPFTVLIGDQANGIVHKIDFTIQIKKPGYISQIDWHPAMIAFVALIAIYFIWNRRFIRKKMNFRKWKLIKKFIALGLVTSLVIYLAQTYSAFIYISFVFIMVSFSVCCALGQSRQFRRQTGKYRDWKEDIYQKRHQKWVDFKNKVKSIFGYSKQKKRKKNAKKRAKEENFITCISKGHDIAEDAKKYEKKQKFSKAIRSWNRALEQYKQAKKFVKTTEERAKIEDIISSLYQNLLVCYYNNGLNLKKQAVRHYKKKELDEAKKDYRNAIENLQTMLKLKKNFQVSNIEGLTETNVQNKIEKYRNRIRLFDYTQELYDYQTLLEILKKESEDPANLVDIDPKIYDLLAKFSKFDQKVNKEKSELFDILKKASKTLLENTRIFREEIDEKFDKYLGKVESSKLSVESDEEEEIDDADLLGLNNIKPEKRKIKQRISTQEEKSMLEKFKRIIKISQEVEMEDVAESLKITEEQLFEKLIEWGEDLPFKIKGDLIVVENLSAFIGALDKQFEVWEERDKTKEGKI